MAIISGDGLSNNLIGTSVDDTISGNGGDDSIVGLGGNDWIVGGLGRDSMAGGAGDDIFEFRPGDTGGIKIVNGGAGIDTLLVSSAGTAPGSGAVIAETDALFSSIERIWLDSANNDVSLFVALIPLFPSGFSPSLEIVGGDGKDTLEILMGHVTRLDLSGATFTNWQSDDRLLVYAYGAYCTVSGTGLADEIWVDGSGLIRGNEGNDTFAIDGLAYSSTISGGEGWDRVILRDNVDFLESSLRSIEDIKFESGEEAIFSSNAFDPATSGFGQVSRNLHFTDGASSSSVIKIRMHYDTDGWFSAANFSFTDWDADDGVYIQAGMANDTIIGSTATDVVEGGGGDDRMFGGEGNDELSGDAGTDTLWGGEGEDVFFYLGIGDSGVAAGLRDIIADFSAGDTIHLSLIDANATLAGDQAFVIDTDGVLAEGEIQLLGTRNTLVRINSDADADVDMELNIFGVSSASLLASDFVL